MLVGVAKSVIEIRKVNPCALLKDIGDKVGVTRERVRQILKRANLPTRHYIIKRHCAKCGVPVAGGVKYCAKCHHELHHVKLICDTCGIMFERKLSHILAYPSRMNKRNSTLNMKQVGIFCTKKCFGKWAGNHFGFKTHPENIPSGEKWRLCHAKRRRPVYPKTRTQEAYLGTERDLPT